jgi:hypothetical protein
MIALVLGCLAECVGYIARIFLWDNPYNDMGFNIQIVLRKCLCDVFWKWGETDRKETVIFAPSFLAAGIYLTLKHVVIQFGESWSRLKPNWYTYIFVTCDISSLAMQSAGGALAATADPGEKIGDVGTNLMIGGIIWQVVGMSFLRFLSLSLPFS